MICALKNSCMYADAASALVCMCVCVGWVVYVLAGMETELPLL